MRIAVCVKSAASPASEDFEVVAGARVDPDDLEHELNDWDRYAVEAALELAAGADDCEVVVVTVGGDEAEEALRRCLAMGADRAARVDVPSDDAWVADDALAVARALAGVLSEEAPDLVLCGAQSGDAAQGATGAALGALLDMPVCAVVTKIDWRAAEGRATVHRELEGGVVEVVDIATPAVLTVQSGINEPRYATLRAIKLAGRQEIPVVASATPELAGARVRRMYVPDGGDGAERIEGPPSEIAERIKQIVEESLRS